MHAPLTEPNEAAGISIITLDEAVTADIAQADIYTQKDTVTSVMSTVPPW